MRLLIICILLSFSSFLLASEYTGFVKKLNGEAIILRDNNTIKVAIGIEVFEKDTVKTKKNSSLGIIFKDNTLISLGSNTEFIIKKYSFDPAEKKISFFSEIVKGTMTGLTGLISKLNPDAMKIKAKSASIGIRGTHFVISVD